MKKLTKHDDWPDEIPIPQDEEPDPVEDPGPPYDDDVPAPIDCTDPDDDDPGDNPNIVPPYEWNPYPDDEDPTKED